MAVRKETRKRANLAYKLYYLRSLYSKCHKHPDIGLLQVNGYQGPWDLFTLSPMIQTLAVNRPSNLLTEKISTESERQESD